MSPPSALRAPAWVGVSLLLVLLVGAGDYATGEEISFTLVYLAPIATAVWFVGRGAGVAVSFLCALDWLVADAMTRRIHPPPLVRAWNVAVELAVFLTFAALLASLRRRLEAGERLARVDALTGLANRRSFIESAGLELERARRTGRPLTVAYLDVDGFKAVNDRLGHQQGDALLAALGATLKGGVRSVDVVARLGGDEFGLLLPETDAAAAVRLLARLREAALAAVRARWPVTLSVGAVTFRTLPGGVDQMIARADRLMYEVKNAGKDAVRHELA